jgi:pyrimidine deaminase RibD-like protein
LAITYTSSNPSVATIVGGKMHTLAKGIVTITAAQSGNSNYNAATCVARLFNVAGLAQTINFPNIEPKEFNSADFDGGAVASSGLPIIYTSSNTGVASIVNNKIRIVGAGTTTITATQMGDETYAGAIATVNLLVTKQKQTISFANLDVKNHNDTDFDLNARSSSELPIIYTSSNTAVASIIGNRVHIVAAGTTIITASQAGNANILAAPDVARNLDVFFNIPTSNFTIKSTDETCKTSDNGTINITAAQTLAYTATFTGNNKTTTYPFNSVLAINNLTAGIYNLCITVAGQANYKQCFDIAVKEPKDLAVYSSLKNDESLLVLKLEGSDFYKIELNGQLTTTTQQEITLPLIKGSNVVKISSDKTCQGVIEKVFLTTGGIVLYPNPVKDILNISTARIDSNPSKIDIHAVDGRLVHSSQQLAGDGRISLDLSSLSKGVYVLTLSIGNTKTVHKIIKD